MDPALTLLVRERFGTQRMYPACPQSHLLVVLTGKLTFALKDLVTLKALGYEVTLTYETENV